MFLETRGMQKYVSLSHAYRDHSKSWIFSELTFTILLKTYGWMMLIIYPFTNIMLAQINVNN